MYLDLSKAFDSVVRDTLWNALRNIGISPQLLTLLEFLHLGSQYHVTNGQLCTQLLVTKGVRQGCKAAPLLWTVLVYELFQQLQQQTGPQWLRDYVTAFADDFNIAYPIHCSADLDKHLRCVGQLLDLMQTFGLKVNPEKCTVLLTLKGSASKDVLQQYTCWQHGKRHLYIPCRTGYTLMPIESAAQYLGVTLSYTNTAALTQTSSQMLWTPPLLAQERIQSQHASTISTLAEDSGSNTDIWCNRNHNAWNNSNVQRDPSTTTDHRWRPFLSNSQFTSNCLAESWMATGS